MIQLKLRQMMRLEEARLMKIAKVRRTAEKSEHRENWASRGCHQRARGGNTSSPIAHSVAGVSIAFAAPEASTAIAQ